MGTLNSSESTLPIELVSFSAVAMSQSNIRLDWMTQSETGVLGYYLLRSSTALLSQALLVSPLIHATNTSSSSQYTFTDREVPGYGTSYYWLQNIDIEGRVDFHGPVEVNMGADPDTPPTIPLVTELLYPYPNPFNPNLTITFTLRTKAPVSIQICNIRGQVIRSLLSQEKTSGRYSLVWDGTNGQGKSVVSGIYYVRMQAGSQVFHRKVVLLK